jgi:hypothetical protein
VSGRGYQLRDLAWAARAFAHTRCLAKQAAKDGLRELARFYGAQARSDWERLASLLNKGGALS